MDHSLHYGAIVSDDDDEDEEMEDVASSSSFGDNNSLGEDDMNIRMPNYHANLPQITIMEEDEDDEEDNEEMDMDDDIHPDVLAAMQQIREQREQQQQSAAGVGIVDVEDEDEDEDDMAASQRRGRQESDTQRRKRRQREEEEYYEDEYGEGNPDMYGLRQTTEIPKEFFQDGDDARFIDDDVEPEEHEAGMILPLVDLSDIDIYYRELLRVVCRMGTETTRLLQQLLIEKKPLDQDDRRRCKIWIKYWTSYVVEHHYQILGKIIKIPTGPNGESESISGSMCIMCEVWRLKLIINHYRLDNLYSWKVADSPFLMEWLVETPGVAMDPPPVNWSIPPCNRISMATWGTLAVNGLMNGLSTIYPIPWICACLLWVF